MLNKDEEKILLAIKILPIILIIILPAAITYVFTLKSQNSFESDIKDIRKEFIQTNKEKIKKQVNYLENIFISKQKKSIFHMKKHIKEEVSEAHSIATNIYNNNRNLGDKQLKKLITDTLRNLRFGDKKGYFFIYSLEGINIMHPIKPELEGKNLIEYRDKKGVTIIKNAIPILKKEGEVFSSWWWTKPNSQKEYKKIGFNKVFKPFNWFIGTGLYVDDQKNTIKDEILNNLEDYSLLENDYFFILNKKGIILSDHHKHKKQNKEDRLTHENINDIKQLSTYGEGFIVYKTRKSGEIEKSDKISYVKYLKDFDWILGYGFHPKDIEAKIGEKEAILKNQNANLVTGIFLINVFVTFILTTLIIIFSDFVEKQFLKYKNKNKKYQEILQTVINKKTSKLIKLNKTLEQRVISEVLKNRKKDKIMFQQSKMAALGELLGMITHQWRQPLAQINSTTMSMYSNFKQGSFTLDTLKKDIIEIENTTNFLSQTITDFSTFFSPDKEKKIFSTKQAVDECLHILFPKFSYQVDIQIDVKEDVPINGYITQYQQAVLTILINALDMFEERNIKAPAINIEINSHDEQSKLSISDNAQGINKECLDKIFEAYFSTKKSKKNSGLGLYISKMIIEQNMNGIISAENTKEGAKFIIII